MLVFFGVALACAPGVSRGAPAAGTGATALEGFVRAVQGDTLDARMSNRRIGIGIVGIRAPQGNTPCGKEATAYLQGLVEDGAMIEDGAGSDRYRQMYRVTTLDGRSVAEEMVAAGFARAHGQGANHDRLAALEEEARAAQRGCLWRSGGTQ
jgi:endonuclease YncB( thermonuclease family)